MAGSSSMAREWLEAHPHSANYDAEKERLHQLRLAAESGNTDAQIELGQMYEFGGPIISQEYLLAYMWYAIVEYCGNDQARGARLGLVRTMPREEILTANRMAREWIRGGCKNPTN